MFNKKPQINLHTDDHSMGDCSAVSTLKIALVGTGFYSEESLRIHSEHGSEDCLNIFIIFKHYFELGSYI